MAGTVTPELADTLGASDIQRYLEDPEWAMEEKIDGQRCVTSVYRGVVTAISRNGLERDIPKGVEATLSELPGYWMLDGEIVGQEYWVFDLLAASDRILRDRSWLIRAQCLDELWERNTLPYLQPVSWTAETAKKTALFNLFQEQGAEGVIFKRITSQYKSGRQEDWKKFKFLHTVDCVVTAMGVGGKANLELSVYRDGQPKKVGRVSALTGDGHKVKVGDVVEVTCLYSTPTGRLYHAKMPRLRTDKSPEECGWDQILNCLRRT